MEEKEEEVLEPTTVSCVSGMDTTFTVTSTPRVLRNIPWKERVWGRGWEAGERGGETPPMYSTSSTRGSSRESNHVVVLRKLNPVTCKAVYERTLAHSGVACKKTAQLCKGTEMAFSGPLQLTYNNTLRS